MVESESKTEKEKEKKSPSPALEVAKEQVEQDDLTVLSTGVRARLVPVAASLISKVASRVKDPEVPMDYIEEKDREEPNPDNPEYLRKLEEATAKRGTVSLETMVMFGVELVDGVPEDDAWLKRLRFLEKHGNLDLSEYDLDDPMEREFVYKLYIAVGSNDIMKIAKMSGISPEEVKQAAESFQGSKARDTD